MKKITQIILISLLMLVFVIIVGRTISSNDNAHITSISVNPQQELEGKKLNSQVSAFEELELANQYQNEAPDNPNRRTYDAYMKNRAYNGAPPYIPHATESSISMGGKDCLQCHENGGYVAKFKNFAPRTPHPSYLNCRQCHVPMDTQQLFVSNSFTPVKVNLNNNALQSSPPTIPHGLQLRSNCLACHAGPAAPKEITFDHPERANCLQCHALNGVDKDKVPSWHRTKTK
ncbi:MAG: nitrate reductase cytochrome c-type subunit [Flavobacteriales bacterium]